VKEKLMKVLVIFVMLSLVLTACGGGNNQTSGEFVCPEPEHKVEVTSKELNIFVWTEYIPAEWKTCFEKVYGVKINHSEYSSNEEMYAKLLAGGSNYDLVQPTDYIVGLMIRQGLLQEMDQSKLPMANYNPNYLDLPFDPGNRYTVPYMAGTDAIIYNSDTVVTPPTSFADLWNPEYAGRMVFLDDSRVIIGMTLLTLGYDVNTKDPAQLEEAKVKLAELIPNVKLFDSDSPKTGRGRLLLLNKKILPLSLYTQLKVRFYGKIIGPYPPELLIWMRLMPG
jgi:spermidine/putrescine-binding protein